MVIVLLLFDLDAFHLLFLARTSYTVLNKSGHPCLVPDLREKVFSSSQL